MRERYRKHTAWVPAPFRKVLIFAIGLVVLIIGILMIVLPGPAVVFVPLGLAILSLEFAWAHRLLARARALFHQAAVKAGKWRTKHKDTSP